MQDFLDELHADSFDGFRESIAARPLTGEFGLQPVVAFGDERGPIRLVAAPMLQDATEHEFAIAEMAVDRVMARKNENEVISRATSGDVARQTPRSNADGEEQAQQYAALAMGRLRGMGLIHLGRDQSEQDGFETGTLLPMLVGIDASSHGARLNLGSKAADELDARGLLTPGARGHMPGVLEGVFAMPIEDVRDCLGTTGTRLAITLEHEPEFRSHDDGTRTMLLHGGPGGNGRPVLASYSVPERIDGSAEMADRFNDMVRRIGGGDRVTLVGHWGRRGSQEAGRDGPAVPQFVVEHFVKSDASLEKAVEMSQRVPGSVVASSQREETSVGLRLGAALQGAGLAP